MTDDDGEVVVVPPTEIDSYTVGRFRGQLQAVDPGSHLVIDMSSVTFCDSSGLGAIAGAVQRARGTDGIVVVRNPRLQVGRILQITQLDHYVTIEYTPEPDPDPKRSTRPRNYGEFS